MSSNFDGTLGPKTDFHAIPKPPFRSKRRERPGLAGRVIRILEDGTILTGEDDAVRQVDP